MEARRFEDVNHPKRMLSRNKMDEIIRRQIESSVFPQFQKHLYLQHPRHSTKEDRMSRLRLQHFDKENEMLPSSHFIRNHPVKQNPLSNHLNHFNSEQEMSQFRNKFEKRSGRNRIITQHKTKIGKTKSSQITQLKSNCEGKGMTYQNSSIVCNHLASS